MNVRYSFKTILLILMLFSATDFLFALFGPIGPSELVPFLIVLLVIIVVFLIFREVMCWYWKINQIVSLLKDIQENITSLSTPALTGSQQSEHIGKHGQGEKVEKSDEPNKNTQ